MRVVILANAVSRQELLQAGTKEGTELVWVHQQEEMMHHQHADGFIDLQFDGSERQTKVLRTLSSRPVIVHSVIDSLNKIGAPFVRINAWPGFLRGPVVEASAAEERLKPMAELIFSALNKTIEWVADEPGFITARVIGTIINEAYFALEEKVSSKEEIDTAMKLGTNYPYGPFEWAGMIGIRDVCRLLAELGQHEPRYNPAALLEKEAGIQWL